MTLRVLICDDEQMARRRARRLLEALPEVEVVGEATNGAEALAQLRSAQPDLLLLDVQMPGLSGVDTLKVLGSDGPAVVFSTAHAEFAVDAFDGGAVDYVLKPLDAGRLAQAIERVRSRLKATPPSVPGAGTKAGLPDGRIPVSTRRGIVLVDSSRITHATIDGASVVIHAGSDRYFTDYRLADLERRLGDRFLRVHRQALIHLDHLERLEPVDSGGYLAHLAGGVTVAVSRQAARKLRKDWDLPR